MVCFIGPEKPQWEEVNQVYNAIQYNTTNTSKLQIFDQNAIILLMAD